MPKYNASLNPFYTYFSTVPSLDFLSITCTKGVRYLINNSQVVDRRIGFLFLLVYLGDICLIFNVILRALSTAMIKSWAANCKRKDSILESGHLFLKY